jgi:hypothetical protein
MLARDRRLDRLDDVRAARFANVHVSKLEPVRVNGPHPEGRVTRAG